MRIKMQTTGFSLSVLDNNGDPVAVYSVQEIQFEGSIEGMMQAAEEVSKAVQARLSEDIGAAVSAAIEAAGTNTKQ